MSDPNVLPDEPGRRRSSFTPPTPPSDGDEDYLDDDALADAIAASYTPTGLIPIITPEIAAAFARGEDFADAVGETRDAVLPAPSPARSEPVPASASSLDRETVDAAGFAAETPAQSVDADQGEVAISAAMPSPEPQSDLDVPVPPGVVAADPEPSRFLPPSPAAPVTEVPAEAPLPSAPAFSAPVEAPAFDAPAEAPVASAPVWDLGFGDEAEAPGPAPAPAPAASTQATPIWDLESAVPEPPAPFAQATEPEPRPTFEPDAPAPRLDLPPAFTMPAGLATAPPPDPAQAAGGMDAPVGSQDTAAPTGTEDPASPTGESSASADTGDVAGVADLDGALDLGGASTDPLAPTPRLHIVEPVDITAPFAQPTEEELRLARTPSPLEGEPAADAVTPTGADSFAMAPEPASEATPGLPELVEPLASEAETVPPAPAEPTVPELVEPPAPWTTAAPPVAADAASPAVADAADPAPTEPPAGPPTSSAWSVAPPPDFAPPALVEPPAAPPVDLLPPSGATISGDAVLDEEKPLAPVTGAFDFAALLREQQAPTEAAGPTGVEPSVGDPALSELPPPTAVLPAPGFDGMPAPAAPAADLPAPAMPTADPSAPAPDAPAAEAPAPDASAQRAPLAPPLDAPPAGAPVPPSAVPATEAVPAPFAEDRPTSPFAPPASPPAGAAPTGAAVEGLPPSAASLASAPPPAPGVAAADFPAPPSGAVNSASDAGYEDESDDSIDATDRVSALPVDGVAMGAAAAALPPTMPSEPLLPVPVSMATGEHRAVIEPEHHRAFAVEQAGVEPTALELRAGRSVRMLWLWFAANASIVSVAAGAVIFGLGMSLRQSLVSIVIGTALACLLLGLVTRAGKRTGQPTLVVSRASFGLVGNILPALLALITRALLGGLLLWVAASAVPAVLERADLVPGAQSQLVGLITLGVTVLLAGAVAVVGFGLLARIQLVLAVLTAVLVAGVIALTASRLDMGAALAADDGPWLASLLAGAVIAFSLTGLAWVQSGGDLARYQRPGSSSMGSAISASVGAVLAPFALLVWGALLAASDAQLATRLAADPLAAIAALLPSWYPVPLLAVALLGGVSGGILAIYSGGFALQALGVVAPRRLTTLVAAALVAAVSAALWFLGAPTAEVLRDVVTTLAVPVAAWAGIFAAELMLRRSFSGASLLHRGGAYPDVRVVNLLLLLAVTAIGLGLTTATTAGLTWQGYLLPVIGVPGDDPLAGSDFGVLVALGIAMLITLATAVPAIRKQEAARG